ncbi:ABC transporter ATP-binding protein [Croceivirga radicis]|uniref:ABC transporter ATP-binding protein n=1 Tax=Croceivirga radicis TaxID=1929488 RepID=A0A1V6LVV2_9FLAO|nr:ABC transporter ATP-binding protein [Croceivirga radicis]OQD44311.1 ABC transporter ATP-binding protein [Croceivirga radicis]
MLQVNNVFFAYGENPILKDISFQLPNGSHLALIGESGSGKSTLLKAIYGKLKLGQGEVSWNNQKVLGPDFNLIPGENYMKYVSQDLDLMPFTTVSENIGEHLSVFEPETHQARIQELLEVIQLEDYAHVKVKNLSGGQQQRVAIAKALAQEPKILLLDEPFSSIDQFKKNGLKQLLFPYLKEKGITVINATHDPDDILPFSWLTLVLKDGEILDFGPTKNVYNHPKNLYAASLFGEANTIPLYFLNPGYYIDRPIIVYPHELSVTQNSDFMVTVEESFFKGSHFLVKAFHETNLMVWFIHSRSIIPGTKVALKGTAKTLLERISKTHAKDYHS